MKTNKILKWYAGVLTVASVGMIAYAAAASDSACPACEKTFKGKVESVNSTEHLVKVRSGILYRTFNLGEQCAITLWDGKTATINDLRPGERVRVEYRNVGGVLAADRIRQNTMRLDGMVQSTDPTSRLLVLHRWDHNTTFRVPADCKIVLHDKASGTLESIRTGDHVAVLYETPSRMNEVALQITQPSDIFTGSVVAIDLQNRLISAKGTVGIKQFSLPGNCAIVMYGKTDAPLADVRPGERLTISYEEVNGVNVANRIAPTEAQEATTAGMNP